MHKGHRGHGHVLYPGDGRSSRAGSTGLGWLNAEERVEKGVAELAATCEIHEEVDGVVGVVHERDQCVEQPSYGVFFRCHVRECPVGVPDEIDIDRDAEDEEKDANDYQHHSSRCNLHTTA